MIEIDHALLSEDALENLIIDIITRQTTDYGDYEFDLKTKKQQLMNKLNSDEAIIIYSSKEECCEIVEKTHFLKHVKNHS